MRLNHECVRALLLYFEENLKCNSTLDIRDIQLDDFSLDEITYTTQRLSEAGYIFTEERSYINGSLLYVKHITWDGHKFLDTVRDSKVWKTTKGIVSKLASVSLSMVENIASQVLTNLISQYMLQNPPMIN